MCPYSAPGVFTAATVRNRSTSRSRRFLTTAAAPDPKSAARAASELFDAANADMGSNAVAFGGGTTAGGRGLLLGNPHYPWAGGRRFWQAQQTIPGELNVSGGALLGSLVAFGAGFAASDTMVAKMIPEVFGLRAIAAIMGILTLGWRLGAAVGPALAGFLYDAAGSYRIPFGAAPLAVLLSWGLFALGTATRRR